MASVKSSILKTDDLNSQVVYPHKTITLNLAENSIVGYCLDDPVRVEAFYTLAVLNCEDLMWCLESSNGDEYGAVGFAKVRVGRMLVSLASPLETQNTTVGVKAKFRFQLPIVHHIHYLSYLRKTYPHLVNA